jgi:hypothetical protein
VAQKAPREDRDLNASDTMEVCRRVSAPHAAPKEAAMINWTPSDEEVVDVDQLRARLVKMTDAELKRFGKAAKDMCSLRAMGKPPRPCFVVQLDEALAEWRKRHRKLGY